MSRAAWCGVGLLVACGRFEPVAEPGPGSVSGCLVDDAFTARPDVSVFATREGVVLQQTRSSSDGCFVLEGVPSGRLVLAVNDFHGHGLTEPIRVYAHQDTRVGRRVLEPLAINPVMPSLRGVGFVETLASGSLFSCDNQRLELGVAPSVVQWANLEGVVQPGLLEAEGEASVTRVLRRRDSGAVLPLGDGENCWLMARIGPSLAAVHGGRTLGSSCSSSSSSFRLVTPETEYPIGSAAFAFVAEGRGARALELGLTDAVFQEFDGTSVTRQTLASFSVDDRMWLMASDLTSPTPTFLFLFTDGVTKRREIVVAQPGRPLMRIAVPDGHDVMAAAAPGRLSWLTYTTVDLTLSVTGADDAWALFDTQNGALQSLPAPSLSAARRMVWQAPLHFDGDRPQFVAYSPDGLTVTLFEHLGASVRERSLTMPPLSQPNYVSGTWPLSPLFSMSRVPALGLELMRLGDEVGLRLGREGAPLNEAVPVSSFALPPTPVCALGGQVYLTGAEPNLSTSVFRYDVARLADELLPPR